MVEENNLEDLLDLLEEDSDEEKPSTTSDDITGTVRYN